MSVAPIEKSKSSTASLNTSSTSLVISKESGVVLVHPDDKKLPESFEYVQPKKGAGMYVLGVGHGQGGRLPHQIFA